MNNLISQVHLFVALDVSLSPGPILQTLDYFRAKEWQTETVLLCDISWKPYIDIDHPIIFLNKEDFYIKGVDSSEIVNMDVLNQFLEQLDSFDIVNVTQIGKLSWGRWLQAYLEETPEVQYLKVAEENPKTTSIELINQLSEELAIDLSMPTKEKNISSSLYIDPYTDNKVSPIFMSLLKNRGSMALPEWLNIIVRNGDHELYKNLNIEDSLIEYEESEISLFNQSILCFDDTSTFAQSSRSYNVATFNCKADQSLFVQGDISIKTDQEIHFSELINILSYWKVSRLKELAFQWFNMGIEIQTIEIFHNRIVKRNLLNYASDLQHCQKIVDLFTGNDSYPAQRDITQIIYEMRKENNNDPYSLSFSLKILIMITERMLASAVCGERLFQRLGSDYHRIIIGEALIETVLQKNQQSIHKIDIKKQLSSFLKLLLDIDFRNDQAENFRQIKEF
jgi:hypothetical protein